LLIHILLNQLHLFPVLITHFPTIHLKVVEQPLLLRTWQQFHLKCWYLLLRLHNVTSQKMVIFIRIQLVFLTLSRHYKFTSLQESRLSQQHKSQLCSSSLQHDVVMYVPTNVSQEPSGLGARMSHMQKI
jgi:hypothetical protein